MEPAVGQGDYNSGDNHVRTEGTNISDESLNTVFGRGTGEGMNRREFTLLPLILFSGIVSAAMSLDCIGEERDAEARAERIWLEISNARSTATENHQFDVVRDWTEIAIHSHQAFLQIARAEDRDRLLDYFVRQFGKHGAQADMRWLLVDVEMTLPTEGIDMLADPSSEKDPSRKVKWAVRHEFCKLLVARCLSDEGFFHRYYQAVFWSGQYFGSDQPHAIFSQNSSFGLAMKTMREGLKTRPAEERWWYARSFLLLAHAVGRDDLLKGLDASNINDRYAEFERWFDANRSRLRADSKNARWKLEMQPAGGDGKKNRDIRLPAVPLPTSPFSDWKGVPPPTQKLIEELPALNVGWYKDGLR